MSKIKALNLKGHLLTAISYLIPIVCGAGFLIAIGMAFGGSNQAELIQGEFSIWDALATMGGAGLGLLPVDYRYRDFFLHCRKTRHRARLYHWFNSKSYWCRFHWWYFRWILSGLSRNSYPKIS